MHSHSLHEVRADAFNYVWDNSIAPVLEVESGTRSSCMCATPGDEQIGPDSGVDAVVALDFSHVNPVSGPVAVKGARPGDVLAVEILELRPRDWGWTAIIPGFGLLADEFPEPWLRISESTERAPGPLRRGHHAAVRALPGHDRRRDAGAGPALDRAAVDLGRQPRHQAPARGHDAVPAGRRRGRAVLGRRHARGHGRRRGVRHRGRGGDGHRRAPERPPRLLGARAAVPVPAGELARTERRPSTSAPASPPT